MAHTNIMARCSAGNKLQARDILRCEKQMLGQETPLRGHTLFQSACAADLCQVRDHLGATCVVPPVCGVDVCANSYELPCGELWYLETQTPIEVHVPEGPFIRTQSDPESKAFVAILNCILANIDHAGVLASPFVLAELEEALIVSMLFNFSHNMRELLEQEVLEAGSWQVRRVEEYIEAHLDAPFDIERIAAVTGISTRSIYRAFKRSRGYSPMAFARQRRLQRARHMLEEAESNQTVTSVAFLCGFNDVGHFSREFSKAFGEAPSAVLGKRVR